MPPEQNVENQLPSSPWIVWHYAKPAKPFNIDHKSSPIFKRSNNVSSLHRHVNSNVFNRCGIPASHSVDMFGPGCWPSCSGGGSGRSSEWRSDWSSWSRWSSDWRSWSGDWSLVGLLFLLFLFLSWQSARKPRERIETQNKKQATTPCLQTRRLSRKTPTFSSCFLARFSFTTAGLARTACHAYTHPSAKFLAEALKCSLADLRSLRAYYAKSKTMFSMAWRSPTVAENIQTAIQSIGAGGLGDSRRGVTHTMVGCSARWPCSA